MDKLVTKRKGYKEELQNSMVALVHQLKPSKVHKRNTCPLLSVKRLVLAGKAVV